MRSVVVTGRAGFIGSHMVDLLVAENYKVFVVDDLSCGSLINLEKHNDSGAVEFVEKSILDLGEGDAFFKNADCVFTLRVLVT